MSQLSITRRRALVKAGLAAAASVASWPLIRSSVHAAAPAHRMVYAHTFTQATEKYYVTGIDLFKQLAEKYSDGRLAVDVHGGGKLGGQTELPQKVQSGAVHACLASMQNFTPYAEVFNILDFPFLFPNNAIFEKYLEAPEFAKSRFTSEPESKGLKVLVGMWGNSGFRVFCVGKRVGREVRLPGDLKGLKVRVTNSKVEQQSFALTPASPVSLAWAETYQAMQQGTVDALNVGLGPLTASRIQETVATATRLDMSFNASVTVVGTKWYDALPSTIRDAIDRAARESWAFQQHEQLKANERMWQEWKQLGIKIVDLSAEQKERWIAAIGHKRPEWKSSKDKYGAELYEQIVNFVAKGGR